MNQSEQIHILQKASTIKQKYDALNLEQGVHFNIFSIMRAEWDEVRTHSRVLGELLNPNGSHGYENLFLKEFIRIVEIEAEAKKQALTDKYEVILEEYLGPKTENSGGSIDIVIKNLSRPDFSIIIENKVRASEQKNQLLRYRNAYPKSHLIYLTRFGTASQQKSSIDTDYIQMSYSEDIVRWVERCIEIVNKKPRIKQILSHYCDTIRTITNQNTNALMNNDLKNLILDTPENFESFQALEKAARNLKSFIIEHKIVPALKVLAKKHALEFSSTLDGNWPSFRFENTEMLELGVCINFSSSSKSKLNSMVFGFLPKESNNRNQIIEKKLQTLFRQKYKPVTSGYENWAAVGYTKKYKDWENLDTLKTIYFSTEEFILFIEDGIEKLLGIVNNVKV